jgi:hypothetical protein
MQVYYHFLADNDIPYKDLLHIINANYHEHFSLHTTDNHSGYILADTSFYDMLLVLSPLFNSDLGISLSCLVAHHNDQLAKKALLLVSRYKGKGVYHLATLLIDLLHKGDHQLDNLIKKEIVSIDRELILTATAFIESGLNASRAAKKLYVHRNTFIYRMDRFKNTTNLNIRDFHQALYFVLALKIANVN